MEALTSAEISSWIAGNPPSTQRVDTLAETMPWFVLPAAMSLRYDDSLSYERRAQLAARLAINAPDPEQMAMAADIDLQIDLAGFYPQQTPVTPTTDDTIATFISNYGSSDPHEDQLLERLIFNPTPDYAQMLAQEEEESMPDEEEAPEGSQDALINSFIIKSKSTETPPPTPRPKAESTVQKPAEANDSLLSESLARIYIRRGNYRKAFEIISNLNLNFPEKSVYFADQLRFLGKLIAIEERKSVHK